MASDVAKYCVSCMPGMGDQERILPDPRKLTGSGSDPDPVLTMVKARGSGISSFHRIPDPNWILLDPFLTTLWGPDCALLNLSMPHKLRGSFTSTIALLLLCQCSGSEFTQHNLTKLDPPHPVSPNPYDWILYQPQNLFYS